MFFLPLVPVLANGAAVPGKVHSSSDLLGLCKGVESTSAVGIWEFCFVARSLNVDSKTGRERGQEELG